MIKKSKPKRPWGDPDSKAERNILEALTSRGFTHTYQQQQKSNSRSKYCYRVDIAIIRPIYGLRIDVEIDGDFKRDDAYIQFKMDRRNKWFAAKGWHVVRFHASDCYRRAGDIADDIIWLTGQMTAKHSLLLEKKYGNKWRKFANHGLESTSAPPAAGTLETHP